MRILTSALLRTFTIHAITTKQFENFARGMQAIGFILGTFMAVTWTVFPDRRKQFFVRLFLYMSWGLSFSFVVAWINPGSRDRVDRFCSTNATPREQGDGGYCIAQGFFVQVFEELVYITCLIT
jgi:hypothetical protein